MDYVIVVLPTTFRNCEESIWEKSKKGKEKSSLPAASFHVELVFRSLSYVHKPPIASGYNRKIEFLPLRKGFHVFPPI